MGSYLAGSDFGGFGGFVGQDEGAFCLFLDLLLESVFVGLYALITKSKYILLIFQLYSNFPALRRILRRRRPIKSDLVRFMLLGLIYLILIVKYTARTVAVFADIPIPRPDIRLLSKPRLLTSIILPLLIPLLHQHHCNLILHHRAAVLAHRQFVYARFLI